MRHNNMRATTSNAIKILITRHFTPNAATRLSTQGDNPRTSPHDIKPHRHMRNVVPTMLYLSVATR
ncbi:MAG TPA: hypothetical protein VF666_12045 [Pyrinomonadaceae bacterium]